MNWKAWPAVATLLCALAGGASAQTFDLIGAQFYEPIAGSYSLHHARSVALGGAYTTMVQDASALWYNPAALARIGRTEIQTEVDYNRIEGESLDLTAAPAAPPPTVDSTSALLTATRLGSAYLAIPLKNGASDWALGMGMAVVYNMDRVLVGDLTFAPGDFVDVLDSTTTEEIHDYEFSDDQRGVVRAWQFGAGGKLSPHVMVGAAGVYYYGSLDFTSRTTFSGLRFEGSNPAIPVRWDISTTSRETMRGWGGHASFLWQPGPMLAIGGILRSPVTYTIDTDRLVTETRDLGTPTQYTEATTRKLKVPLTVTAGASLGLGGLRVTGDASYTDWSQLEYTDSFLSQYNDSLRLFYADELAVGVGAELAMFQRAVSFRGGIRYATVPYEDFLIVDDCLTYSAGIGFVFDRVMSLDVGASLSEWRGSNPVWGFDERYTRTRILVTAAYSFN